MPNRSDNSSSTKAEVRLLEIKAALAKSEKTPSNPNEGEFLGALEQQMLIYPSARDPSFLVSNTLPASLNPQNFQLFDLAAFAASYGYTYEGQYIDLSNVHFSLLSVDLTYVKIDFADLRLCNFNTVTIYSSAFTNNDASYITSDPDSPLLLGSCDVSSTVFSSVFDNHGQPTSPLGLTVQGSIGQYTNFGGSYTKSQFDFISADSLFFPVKGGMIDSTITIAGSSSPTAAYLNGQFTNVTLSGSFSADPSNAMSLVITKGTISGSLNLVDSEYAASATFRKTKFIGGKLSGPIDVMDTCKLQQVALIGAIIQTAVNTQFIGSTIRDTTFAVSAKQSSFAGSKLYSVDLSKASVTDCDFRRASFSSKEPVKLGDTTGSNFLHTTCDTSTSNSTSTTIRSKKSGTSSGENRALILANNSTLFPTCHAGRTTPLLTDGCVIPAGNISDNKGLPCEASVPLLVWLIPTLVGTAVAIFIVVAAYKAYQYLHTKDTDTSADSVDVEQSTDNRTGAINDGDVNETSSLLPAHTDEESKEKSSGLRSCFG